MQRKLTAAAGIALTCLGVLGFFTFAEDLRHLGELSVAIALLFSGLSFTFLALRSKCDFPRNQEMKRERKR